MVTALRCGKGETAANAARHLELLEHGRREGCDIVVFPEMSLSGSVDPRTHAGDAVPVDHPDVEAVVAATGRGPSALFGLAEANFHGGYFITQVLASGGRLVAYYRKRHFGFDEGGFTPGEGRAVLDLGHTPVGVAICAESNVNMPFDEAAEAGAGVTFFCAAPGLYGRRRTDGEWADGLAWWASAGLADVRRHARRCGLWIAVSTQAGATRDEDFPGLAAFVDPSGSVVSALPDWRAGHLIAEVT
jgi:predicted amidohydrolase